MAQSPIAINYYAPQHILEITWSDGHVSRFPTKLLRSLCPCAGCVDERTGVRTLDPETVSTDIDIQEMDPVGNYAIRFRWSDGHETGIYSWEHLARIHV
jgi:DUF971 family protein